MTQRNRLLGHVYLRAVFFVANTERSLRYYVDQLGFAEDWAHREEGTVYVCQVSLFGFELILNQAWGDTLPRAGHGRVYLEDDQIAPVTAHIEQNGIATERRDWGQPTLVIKDLDGNEIFLWDWPDKSRQG